ncbi:MAG: helix-turn-helix domain-containing protein [Eubacterium sp.]|nr:helix-turn-helix domain-containing protein [Eubacterium sp.]
MKLSMWMIANRLSPLMDIKTSIRPDAAPVLKSARLVYSTDCVHVYPEKNYVVCSGEGDKIYLYDVTVKEAFEIIQDVFDFYQDWEDGIQKAVQKNDFQKITDSCELMIQNPMNIQDANNRLLAISRHPDPATVDPEWEYISRYGYSSLNAIKAFDLSNSNIDLSRHGVHHFTAADLASLEYGGLSYILEFNGVPCGRMTVLEMVRPANAGDCQILDRIAQYLEPALGTITLSGASSPCFNAIYSLIFHRTYDPRELQMQLTYQQWTENDDFQMLLIQPDSRQNSYRSVEILYGILQHNLPSCVIFRKDPFVLVLSNQILEGNQNLTDFLTTMHKSNQIRAAFSLGAKGTAEIPWMLNQCLFAIKNTDLKTPDGWLTGFAPHAIDYILFFAEKNERVHACHPLIRKLWYDQETNHDETFQTLLTYLDNERSVSKTSAVLFTHRNTVMYRIRKLQEIYPVDLNDPQTRYYLRLSMEILSSPVRLNMESFRDQNMI